MSDTLELPEYDLYIINDDHHNVEFVTRLLKKYFNLDDDQCIHTIDSINNQGKSLVCTGTKEYMEFKQFQVARSHFDPDLLDFVNLKVPPLQTEIIAV